MTDYVVPEGWVLVPKLPTKIMIDRGYESVEYEVDNPYRHIGETIYLAMLEVAPLYEKKETN